MIYSTGVQSTFEVAAGTDPDTLQAVSSRCRLKALLVMGNTTMTATGLYDEITSAGSAPSGSPKIVIGLSDYTYRYLDPNGWFVVPGNGVLFDNGIFVKFDMNAGSAKSITLVYQR